MLAQAEALVRLRGGSGQAVPPDSFLPVAERTDLILLHDPRIGLLMRGFVRMVQELGLRVVAEGIETVAQRDALLAMGCRIGQGWLFGRPGPPGDLAAFAAEPRLAV